MAIWPVFCKKLLEAYFPILVILILLYEGIHSIREVLQRPSICILSFRFIHFVNLLWQGVSGDNHGSMH